MRIVETIKVPFECDVDYIEVDYDYKVFIEERKLVIQDITYYFKQFTPLETKFICQQPFIKNEFTKGSETYNMLEKIEKFVEERNESHITHGCL